VTAAEWATVADVATALGTLVLAFATFAAIRSANDSARVAERALLAGMRPVLAQSRRDDPEMKVNYGDQKWVHIPPGGAVAEIGGGDGSMGPADCVIYLAIGLRNVGTGMAVLRGWYFYPEWYRAPEHAPLEAFHEQARDLYVPPSDTGFWQAAFRDVGQPDWDAAKQAIESRSAWTVELLYGDFDGGQRVVTRFQMLPRSDPENGNHWLTSVSRYWNLDRPDPK
jgi:hypothetical protein